MKFHGKGRKKLGLNSESGISFNAKLCEYICTGGCVYEAPEEKKYLNVDWLSLIFSLRFCVLIICNWKLLRIQSIFLAEGSNHSMIFIIFS